MEALEQEAAEVSLMAESAYNAFAAMVDFKDVNGDQLVQYPDSSLENRRAWEAVVKAVVMAYEDSKKPVEQVSRFATDTEKLSAPQPGEYTPYDRLMADGEQDS